MVVQIIRPTGKKKITVSWLEVDTNVGNFVIQRGHAPMILTLPAKKLITILLTSGKQETIEVPSGGILEVQRDSLKLLLNE